MGAGAVLLLISHPVVLAIGILIGFILARRFKENRPGSPPLPPPALPPPAPTSRYKVLDQLSESDLTATLSVRLAGTVADGVPTPAGSAAMPAPAKMVWVDHGNEVLVHLDSTVVRILDRAVLVSVDLETDQTGRTPLVCSFCVSGADELGGLVATTDELPRGNGALAAAWGQQLQTAVWSSLMGLANDHAAERNLTPRAISAAQGRLSLSAGGALTAVSSTRSTA